MSGNESIIHQYINMTYLRDTQGRFRASRFIAMSLVLGMAGIFVASMVNKATATTNYQTVEKIVTVDNLTLKIGELKDEVLTKLEKCESGGFSESDAPIVFDSNNRASIGTFQFQKRTVQHYFKALYGQEITQKQAVEIAIDAEKSRKLALDIIFTYDKGTSDWKNCSVKLGLDKDISFIKKLR